MISGVILARNEEQNIVDCVAALRPHVEEIILIDMESRDRTTELARPIVEQVLTHPLDPNFDAARNLAIPAAKNEWLWFVDADERIPVRTGQLVRQLVQERGSDFESLLIPFKSYFCGRWMQHCGWWPGYTMPRVLKRGYFQFAKALHAGVELAGRQIRLSPDPELAIEHYSYQSLEHYLEKLNRYTTTEALQLAERGIQFDWRDAIRHMTTDLWSYYEAHPGHLDGEHGWILSWLSGQYRWLSHAKLLERKPTQCTTNVKPSIPENLDEVVTVMRDQLALLRAGSPQLPLGIVWRSPVWDPSGYADECRTFLKALSRGIRPLRLEDIRWSSQECELPETETALLRALTRAERPRHWAAITDCIPSTCVPDARAALNILRTTFETDRIPEIWLPALDKYDEIWVTSRHNCHTFRRCGVSPEKLRVVPSCVDTEHYRPDGPRLELPPQFSGRFVFLSVFDWALRKGWDLLLKAYCQAFDPNEQVGLLLKLTRSHLHPLPYIIQQADELLACVGQSLQSRPDIVLCDAILNSDDMAALYRSAQAFVLPSRGEGWGRPYMEAMASGLPTIGTRATGNIDFMDDSNSFLLDTTEVDVPEEAAREIPVYRGHRWQEPDLNSLKTTLLLVARNEQLRQVRAKKATLDIQTMFGLTSGKKAIESALAAAESRFTRHASAAIQPHQVRVELEGELFACHSFSKVNEQLALQLLRAEDVALSLNRIQQQPTFEKQFSHATALRSAIHRRFEEGPELVIRHMYPPNWVPPAQGKWVHIQPWEYGKLPLSWVAPLRDRVDEIWVPSEYVKRIYQDSGIPVNKIQVIPWGVDPDVYSPDAPPRFLPSSKRFMFLFVGGTIARKGFDLLLQAYLAEFEPQEDVCLVVKDVGSDSFYRDSTLQATIKAAIADKQNPQVVYLDEMMTEGQLASLYTACHCFVAPYRGEGFGLPILEAMACDLPAIVPRGGASDDFVSSETGIFIPSQVVEEEYRTDLGCRPTHLEVSIGDLRRAMRQASQDPAGVRSIGSAASQFVRKKFTWEQTANLIHARIKAMVPKANACRNQRSSLPTTHFNSTRPLVSACIVVHNSERQLANCLARIRPEVDRLIVCDRESSDRSLQIAREYSAELVSCLSSDCQEAIRTAAAGRLVTQWSFWSDIDTLWDEIDLQQLRHILESQVAEIDQFQFRPRHTCRADGTRLDRLLITRIEEINTSGEFSGKVECTESDGHRQRTLKPYGRTETIDKAMAFFLARQGRLVVEIGSIRESGNVHGDGYSTVAWAQHAEHVYSVDTNPLATALTQKETAEFGNVSAITQDGIEFLRDFSRPIDLLYLDAWDAHEPGSQENHLRAYLEARKNLHVRSLILIDDTDLGEHSKGRLVIPQAVKDGWSILFSEHKQTLLGVP